MTVKTAKQYINKQIQSIYDEKEANNIADLVIEYLTEKKRIDRLVENEKKLSPEQETKLLQFSNRLLQHEPVQYVLGEAWFYGLKLNVDKNVLIPRPETEELVDWMLESVGRWSRKLSGALDSKKFQDRNFKVLDIGTGSGCIAIALRKNLPEQFEVWACDTSDAALTVARKNADDQQALVDFVPFDFLDATQRKQLPHLDIIVSNPPYVPLKDKNEMRDNTLKYEPSIALFVPDNDALVFYKAIADFGHENLYKGGNIFVEIHENLSEAVTELFKSKGYTCVELKKDMHGKDRMVRAAFL
ncbi:MAG: peptide chain release factor N(5)-glutamine methyltransferase [Bacteroidota bacterium]|nr:peptide chain release factor N(5)-glutamine methyltransferase [Bacteroidota bacterium]